MRRGEAECDACDDHYCDEHERVLESIQESAALRKVREVAGGVLPLTGDHLGETDVAERHADHLVQREQGENAEE